MSILNASSVKSPPQKRHVYAGLFALLWSAVVLSVLSLGGAAQEDEGVLVVDEDDEEAFNTVQEAVNAAEDGDTIIVTSGTYTGTTYIGTCESCSATVRDEFVENTDLTPKSLTIRAADGSVVVFTEELVEGEFGTPSFVIGENAERNVHIEGVAFVDHSVAAIRTYSGSQVTLRRNAFENTNLDLWMTPHIESTFFFFSQRIIINDEGNYWGQSRAINPVDFDIFPGINAQFAPELPESPINVFEESDVLVVNSETGDDNIVSTPFRTVERAVSVAPDDSTIIIESVSSDSEITIDSQTARGLEIRGVDGFVPEISNIRVDAPTDVTISNVEISGDVTASSSAFLDLRENWWGTPSGPPESIRTANTIVYDPYCIDEECVELSTSQISSSDVCYTIFGDVESVDTCAGNAARELIVEYEPIVYNEEGIVEQTYRVKYVTDASFEGDSVTVSLSLFPEDRNVGETLVLESGESKVLTVSEQVRTDRKGEKTVRLNALTQYETLSNSVEQTRTIVETGSITIESLDELTERLRMDIVDGDSVIISEGVVRVLEPVDTSFSRFKDGDEVAKPLRDASIPPFRIDSDVIIGSSAQGSVSDFSNVQSDNSRGSVIESDDGAFSIGFATYSLPEAGTHTMSLSYALQSEERENFVRLGVVDSQGRTVDPSAPSRELPSTVSAEVDIPSGEQYSEAISSGIIEAQDVNFQFTSREIQYINEYGELYITAENRDGSGEQPAIGGGRDNVFILFNAVVTSQDTRGIDVSEIDLSDNPWLQDSDVSPATFESSYQVNANINPTYGTYDVRPNDELTYEVTLRNQGDTRVERSIGLYAEWDAPYMASRAHQSGFTGTPSLSDAIAGRVLEERTISLAPREVKTVTLRNSWPEHQYGYHTTKIFDTTTNELVEIEQEFSQEAETEVYVLQPPTLELREITAPDYHLVRDNFDITASVVNVGDLSGTQIVEVEYGDWVGHKEVFVQPGDAREGVAGAETPAVFSRNVRGQDSQISGFWNVDYTPPDEVPTGFEQSVSYPWDDSSYSDFRANSPFSTNIGEHDTIARTKHPFAHPSESGVDSSELFDHLTDTLEDSTELYELQIIELNIEASDGDPTRDSYALRTNETWYASAYPYIERHPTDSGAWNRLTSLPQSGETYDMTSNALRRCGGQPFLPLSASATSCNGVTEVHSPIETDGSTTYMTARVKVFNPHNTQTGTARVAIISDRPRSAANYPVGFAEGSISPTGEIGVERYNDRPEVVGVAGARLGPNEERWLHVPIVIRNDDGNDGVHELRAVPRHELDYIMTREGRDATSLPISSITGRYHDQTTVPIRIETWGDVLLEDFGPQEDMSAKHWTDYQFNEMCTGDGVYETDGHNPTSGGTVFPTDVHGECVGETETGEWLAEFVNYGGDAMEHEIETVRFDQVDNINQRVQDDSGVWATDPDAFFPVSRSHIFEPDEMHRYELAKQFLDPGIYRLRVEPTRDNTEAFNGPLNDYNDHNFGGVNHANDIRFLVYDITQPIANFEMTRSRYDAKSGAGTSNAENRPDTSTEYEVWEGGSLRFDGRESRGYSADNVRIDRYEWTIEGGSPNFMPRDCPSSAEECYSQTFSGSATDGRVYHRFFDAGTHDVTLQVWDDPRLTEGDANTHSVTQSVTVRPDNTPPTVEISNDGSQPIWKSYSPTNYDGVEVCFSIDTAFDNAIGIEADRWDGIDGRGTDNPCRTWSSRGTKTITYNAWDFAGNHNSDDSSVTVIEDNDSPTASCDSSDCSDSRFNVRGEPSGSAESNYPTSWTNRATARECVTFTENGPFGGVGFWTAGTDVSSSGSGTTSIVRNTRSEVRVCVRAAARPSASASAPEPSEPSCEQTNTTYDQDYDRETISQSASITVSDLHGNTASASISVIASADAFDTDKETRTGGDCPPPPDDGTI